MNHFIDDPILTHLKHLSLKPTNKDKLFSQTAKYTTDNLYKIICF